MMAFNWNDMQKKIMNNVKNGYEQVVQHSVNNAKFAQDNMQEAAEYIQGLRKCQDPQQLLSATNKYIKSSAERTMSFVEESNNKIQEMMQEAMSTFEEFNTSKAKK